MGPLLPHDPWEMVMGGVLFLIIFMVIWKVVSPKFEAMYHERSEAIEGNIERAEKAQAEAQAALEKYNAQLAEAHGEASKIREEAKAQGAAIVAEMRDQATAEAARIVAQAKAQIEAERTQAVNSLRSDIGGLATSLAGKIVGESLSDDERARRTVDRFLAELETSQSQAVDHR